jgi:hypothetical protein
MSKNPNFENFEIGIFNFTKVGIVDIKEGRACFLAFYKK